MKLPAYFLRSLTRSVILLTLLFSFPFAARGAAQVLDPSAQQRQTPEETTPWEAKQKHEAEKQRNLQRQRDIRKDTEKLLELATELKQYVDKSNEHTLSVEVIKKADEIEKLAHGVKEKMKGQ